MRKRILTNGLLMILIAPLVLLGVLFSYKAKADQLANRYVKVSNNRSGESGVTYEVGFNRPNDGTVGSVMIEVCANDPFVDTPCDAPTGFSFASSNILDQSGVDGLGIHSNSTANKLILTRIASNVNAGDTVISIGNVANPTISESYFVRLATYVSEDGSGLPVDYGGVAIAFTSQTALSTEVPPYLMLCVATTIPGLSCAAASGNYVDLGDFVTNRPSAGTSQFMVATNAGVGLTVTILGTTMTSGNNIIPAISGFSGSVPGTSQFGINLAANTNPNVGQNPVGPGLAVATANYNVSNRFRFVSGEALVLRSGTTDYKKFTVSYLVNVSSAQAPGVYSSTFLYSALAIF